MSRTAIREAVPDNSRDTAGNLCRSDPGCLMRLKLYRGALNVVIFIDFMKRLVKDAKQKVFLMICTSCYSATS